MLSQALRVNGGTNVNIALSGGGEQQQAFDVFRCDTNQSGVNARRLDPNTGAAKSLMAPAGGIQDLASGTCVVVMGQVVKQENGEQVAVFFPGNGAASTFHYSNCLTLAGLRENMARHSQLRETIFHEGKASFLGSVHGPRAQATSMTIAADGKVEAIEDGPGTKLKKGKKRVKAVTGLDARKQEM